MVLVMRISCGIERACVASAFSPSSAVRHTRRILPTKSLETSAVLFCHNSKISNSHLHDRLRTTRHSFRKCATSNYACGKQRFFNHNASDGYSPTSTISMCSQPTEQQQPSLSTESDGEPQTNTLDKLSEIIQESYDAGETDGVQAAFLSKPIITTLLESFDADEVAHQLVGAAIEAAGSNRGRLAAMINAILASCCGSDDNCDDVDVNPNSSMHPGISLAILDLIDEMNIVTPDIVSLSLVCYSLRGMQEFDSEARAILERAQKIAKKTAGSQRRKALAAERRKASNTDGMDTEQTESHLQSLYGPGIHILHETNDVIAIGKPAGMVCYHTKKTTSGKISRKKKGRNSESSKDGGKQRDISLEDALLDVSVSLSTLNPTARGIVHRLDRGTSGSIVLAKTDEAHLKLVALFFLRRAKKTYLALVPGEQCNTANDVSGDESLDPENEPIPKLTMGTAGVIDSPVDGRPAYSTYKVVKVFGKQNKSSIPEALLLEVETRTGRKHQVRVHCASLGYPIFLEPLYNGCNTLDIKPQRNKREKGQMKSNSTVDAAKSTPPLPQAICDILENSNPAQEQFFLHAMSLSIRELGISVNSPLPNWWADTIDQLD